MNTNKLLRNPVVVVVLSSIALGSIYMNVIRPIVDSKVAEQIPPEDGINDSTANTLDLSESAYRTQSFEQREQQTTQGAWVSLKRIGWRRQAGRDPFLDEVRNASSVFSTALHDSTASVANPDTALPRQKKTTMPPEPLLRAISIGSQGKVALLGTREVREGDNSLLGRIIKIDADSVVLENQGNVRTLYFRKTSKGNLQ